MARDAGSVRERHPRPTETGGMKTSRAIKLTLLLGSVAFSLSQVPRMLEMVEGFQEGTSLGGLSQMGDAQEAFNLLGQLQSKGMGAPGGGGNDEAQLRVFSPDGQELTEAQRAELLAAAERLRPRVERREDTRTRQSAEASGTGKTNGSGSMSDPNRTLISNLDPEMLRQLEQLSGAGEALKSLTEVEEDSEK